jgi:hypothetical protein
MARYRNHLPQMANDLFLRLKNHLPNLRLLRCCLFRSNFPRQTRQANPAVAWPRMF